MSHQNRGGKVSPDGLRFDIDWERFTPGTSIFLPAVNTYKAVAQIRRAANLESKQIEYRVVIEGGRYGVRIWRVI